MFGRSGKNKLGERIRELEAKNRGLKEESVGASLLENRNLVEEIIENSGNLVVIKDCDGVYQLVNRKWEQVTGYSRDFALGKTDEMLFPEKNSRQFRESDRRVIEAGTVDESEVSLDTPGGTRFFISNKFPLVNENEKIIGLCGIITDITERKQAEEALRESELRFKALHNASFGGIIIHDKGIIIECNNGLSEMTGYSREELMGTDGMFLVTEETRELVRRKVAEGSEEPYEGVAVRKTGERYPIRLEARNIPYKGKMVRVVEFRDQTAIKRAEKEKEELERKLLQSQKMEAVGRLAGGVAHDFNNMLSVIIGHAELALSEVGADSAMRAYLEEIKTAGQRSAELTRQLLAFARQQTVAPRPMDLNQCVSGMIRMLERLIGEDVDLLWLPGNEVWPLRIDPSQIDQILANLCVNARDAISGCGKIIIETGNSKFDEQFCADQPGYMPGEYVYIAVSDTGCGMDAETLEHVFEPFFTTKESGKGTGLGLATVYGVIRQNDGFVDVFSEPGEGTLFKLYLPRYYGEDAPRKPQKVEMPPAQSGRGTILLVEDEPMILKMTSKMLNRLGYQVLSTSSPRDAVQQAREHVNIDLLITDVVMPEMNGKDLVQEITSFCPDLKWLFVSGYTANVIAQHGVLDEGVNFIQKPFSRAVLADKVRELIGR